VWVARVELPPEAIEIVKECGCMPLAISLSGGMRRKREDDFLNVLERLRRTDLDKITDRATINEQHQSIWRAMHSSIERLIDRIGSMDSKMNAPEESETSFLAAVRDLS